MIAGRKRPAHEDEYSPTSSENWQAEQPAALKRRMMTQGGEDDTQREVVEGARQETATTPLGDSDSSEYESHSDIEEDDDEDSDTEQDTGPAQAGVIESISLKNFMCHDSFELTLGPQINFIIGKNGSGKSAILTGISAALGAKATTTNRGSGLKDLIKDGKLTARVSIVFWNEGPEAFQPNVYGNRIIIERKLQRVGAHSYYIKSAKGKVISTKKTVLDEILYKFVVTVDNPLAFLSQDRAREFLTTSTDKTKYDYFMKGAHIKDILGNYESTAKNIDEVKDRIIDARRQNKALKRKYEESKQMYDRYRESDSLRKKLETLHGKIYWYNVNVIEGKIHKLEAESTKAQNALEEIAQNIERQREQELIFKSRRENLQKLEEEKTNELSESQQNHDSALAKVNNLKAILLETIQEIKNRKSEIDRLKADIKDEEKQIDKENRRIDEINGESKDELKESLTELETKMSSLTEERMKERDKLRELEGDIPGIDVYDNQLASVRKTKNAFERKKKDLIASQSNKYAAYGPNMQKIVNDIQRTTTWHMAPLGPIGSLVSLKPEYNKWKQLLGAYLSKTLNGFLVCDGHDRAILQRIFNENHATKNTIIVRKFETFNYAHGKPVGETTVVDMLQVENEHILFTLIDSNGIEQSVIANNQVEGSQKIRKRNVRNAFYFYKDRSSGVSLSLNHNVERSDPVFYENELPKFSSASTSITLEVEETDRRIAQLNSEIANLEERRRSLQSTRNNQKRASQSNLKRIDKEIEVVVKAIRDVEHKLNQDGDFEKIESLKAQIKENQEQIEKSEGVITSLYEDANEKNSELKTYKDDLEAVRQTLNDSRATCEEVKADILSVDTELATIETTVEHFQKEQERNNEVVRESNDSIKVGLAKLKECTEEAESKCERSSMRISPSDTSESIGAEYAEVQEQVRRADSEIGRPMAEVQAQLQRDFDRKEQAQETLDSLSQQHRDMDSELKCRTTYFDTTVKVNIQNASRTFENALELRGFKGTLNFNHASKELKLMAKTRRDDEMRTMESLSGGEKSFAQIALLLSIWRVMDSRIRGLDEFDVFMDSVNRSISIKLLLNELRQYPRSQSIFITPQDIAVVGDLEGNDYKIHKMKAPRSEE